MKRLAVVTFGIGTPKILPGHAVTFLATGIAGVGACSLELQFPTGATTSATVLSAVLETVNLQDGLTACGWGSNLVIVLFEVDALAEPTFLVSAVTSGSSAGISIYSPIYVVELPHAGAELSAVEASLAAAQSRASASEAALLVALNDDVTTANSLSQLMGQLSAAQFEIDHLITSVASHQARGDALAAEVDRLVALATAADGRANAARSAAGVATALSIVGVAAANKRVATTEGVARGNGWRKVGDT